MSRLRIPRSSVVAFVLALATLSGNEVALGIGPDKQLGITPSRRDLVGRPPKTLDPTTVFNNTTVDYRMRVIPVILTQESDGAYSFESTPRSLTRARLIMSGSPTEFLLNHGRTQEVKVRWNGLPRGGRAAYVGLVYEGTPTGPQSGSVPQILRLLSVNFLRLPGAVHATGEFTGLRGAQIAPKQLQFLAGVKNTGDVAESPSAGTFVVRDADGKVVIRQDWAGSPVLPGFRVEFPIPIKKILPKGNYSATARMNFGSSKGQQVSTKFTLVGPNELPTPDVDIPALQATGKPSEKAHITADVRSVGTAPVSTRVSVTMYRFKGVRPEDQPIANQRLSIDDLAPGATRKLALDLGPGLKVGDRMRVLLRYRDGDELRTLEAGFVVALPTKRPSTGGGVSIWLVVGGLLVLLLIAYFVWRRLRERRGDDRVAPVPAAVAPPAVVPAAPAAETPPVPAAPAMVDINVASATELIALPGVGPKAAERIIDHREEYGSFESLDDLVRVKGFTPDRIAALRDRARV